MNNKFYGFQVLSNEVLPVGMSWRECKEKYDLRPEESQDFFVYAEIIPGPDMEARDIVIIKYHLIDFSSNIGIRSLHIIIETYPWIRTATSKALFISLNELPAINSFSLFCTKPASLVVKAIQYIERKLQDEYDLDYTLFSGRDNWEFYYHGLVFKLESQS